MTNELDNTGIRELSANELLAVSGGLQICEYEVANRCYVWRDENYLDVINYYLDTYYRR
jgi:hypothetical protein